MSSDAPERVSPTAGNGAAGGAAAGFQSLSAAMRGCAIFDREGLLAATGDGERWLDAGRELLDAADRAAGAGAEATHAHVATEDGEAFVLRTGSLAMVAVTDRFVLASLVFADMRAALRAALQVPAEQAKAT